VTLQIHDLTKEQAEMLTKLWSIDSREDVNKFRDSLPLFRRQQVDTLVELVRLQIHDDEVSESGKTTIAQKMLQDIKINC